MKIYKAGTKYFSTHSGAKTYREKYFSSARWIETINVEENTVKPDEEIVVRLHWFKSDRSGGFYATCYCVGTLSEFLKTDSYLNVLSISHEPEKIVIDAYMAFKNMGAARYRAHSKKLLDLLESEASKVPIGAEVQIKI